MCRMMMYVAFDRSFLRGAGVCGVGRMFALGRDVQSVLVRAASGWPRRRSQRLRSLIVVAREHASGRVVRSESPAACGRPRAAAAAKAPRRRRREKRSTSP